ncbi:ExeM/NucH family extracellular endonuclease [Loktanella sp. Alg231-35]|uniref:ExeM/NucH family extracellular endonuclease n=1 Tax=Loktanella sp. Alg231-35 TaxID=1922220 RepID=UPI001F361E0A|nr:ExeM/NucH family extracellular endonuclease [Loktanella sp. Alg231-35]
MDMLTSPLMEGIGLGDISMARKFTLGIIFGDNGDNTLIGTAGRNIIFGRNGDDVIDGGGGPDIIFGGRGDDTIRAGDGDRIFGGRGFDQVVYSGSVEAAQVSGINGQGRAKVTINGETSRVYSAEELYFEDDDYTVNLRGENNAVLARDDARSASEDGPTVLSGLTDNDFDFDGDALRIESIDTSGLTGSAVLNANGTVTYSADGAFENLAMGETATTELTYTVTDDNGSTQTATVIITVTGENDAPTLDVPQMVSIPENLTEVLTAMGADIDTGAMLTYTISGTDAVLFDIDPNSGLLTFVQAPDFEMPADADQDNDYEVTVTVTDEHGASASDDVTVTVTDVEDGPLPKAWINEFHYDNVGGDTGEFIEVAGTAGLDLTGWELVLYNGSNGSAYNTIDLSGVIADSAGGFGFSVADLPSNGLQNGAPDGIALVNGLGEVVEFISYEGEMTAVDGPAAGLMSQDVGVAQIGAPIGASVQRVGVEDEFIWAALDADTSGATNTGQQLGPVQTSAFLNEFHYDNAGSDVGEFIEVAGTAGADLTGWTLELYNGSNGTVYNTIALSGTLDNPTDGVGFTVVDLPTNGLQNGSPDGIALINEVGEVVEFLSYEGVLTAANGTAAGLTSEDIGAAENGGSPVGGSLQRQADGTWVALDENTSGAVNSGPDLQANAFINEFHYDNEGSDVGEFIEVAGVEGASLSGWTLELYNGSNGTVYNTIALDGTLGNPTDGVGFSVVDLPSNGLQNGSPDGIALINDLGEVVEFLSYEGQLTATNGTAVGLTSVDIGAEESGSTPIGGSLQKQADGTWAALDTNTSGAVNDAGGSPQDLSINEFHYDNAGSDVGEFVEVAGPVGLDLTGWSLVLYNGSNGASYNTISLTGETLQGSGDTGYVAVDAPGIQNGSPDGIALVRPDGSVVEFLSYEGALTATDGPAVGLTSTDIGVAETGTTAIGQSLQKQADGTWSGPEADTRGAANDAVDPVQQARIHEVQGAGDASPLSGLTVGVTGVVTAIMSNGYYLQEEDSDVDADLATSEGIFIFTGGAPTVTITDVVYVEGAVSEFFDFTQITAATESILGTAALPTASQITLPLSGTANLEALEGMRVSVTTDGSEPLTIIENFNFDRFGELTVSAGSQIQPTQIYDAQTQAELIDELQAANLANRITIDDGAGGSNPSTFGYIANTGAGDDGDGILGSGDTFTADGPTLRLGSEITAPIEGVLSFSFGEYKVIPTEVLQIDSATNEGARDVTPPDVGGDLTVVSFNALNYFTTLGERGAFTEEDLARQTEKLVNALVELDGDIIGLQEVENNGFGADSAIAALVDALNTRLGAEVYGYVDPTDDGGPIGTDAISNGIIYKLSSVTELSSDFFIFDDGGQQRNRPAIATSFENADGEVFTVAVNHFKSKGPSGLTAGDPLDPNSDSGDGQGFWNQVRTDAADQLAAWLATDPLGTGDPDVLILGDLNAYSQEDPLQALEAAGYANLIEDFTGAEDAFSFVFDGQRGALDHALSSDSLTSQITGLAEWHINAEEPDLLNYNSGFNDAGFYNGADVFAASDHDPLVIGISLGSDTFDFV